MDTRTFIRHTCTACPLAIACIALALQPAAAAPPIEMVFEDCAAAELPPADHAAPPPVVGDLGCGAGVHSGRCSGHCGGRDVCCATIEEVTEERPCWNVKCEKICVPAIRFPWEPGGSRLKFLNWLCRPGKHTTCGNPTVCGDACTECAISPAGDCYPVRCGAVRYVSVLEADSYEVTTCQCKWEIKRLPCCGVGMSCAAAVDELPFESEPASDPASDPAANGVLPAPRP